MDACWMGGRLPFLLRRQVTKYRRHFSSSSSRNTGLVLGVYQPQEKEGQLILSPAAQKYDQTVKGQLQQLLKVAGRGLKTGGCRVVFGLGGEHSAVAVVNLGKQDLGFCPQEQLDERREAVRAAVGSGCLQLRDVKETVVEVDPCGDAEAAAEGALLSLFSYDQLKAEDKRKPLVQTTCYTEFLSTDRSRVEEGWSRGVILAEAQNIARNLMETPSNKMTPSIFCEEVTKILPSSCKAIARDQKWAESEKMGAFLAVAQGSAEQPRFLEVDYQGAQPSQPVVALVGKGVTFDTGGISIKPSANMDQMRADMGGAACVTASIIAAARLRLSINIKGFIPLCENMPSGTAIKPGDVVTARNGKTIQIDNTDAEGRLILADALCYAESFNPQLLLDVATLTGAIDVALGAGAAGVYSNCSSSLDLLRQAGASTGDRVWSMPLFKLYQKQIQESKLADVNNIGKHSRSGGSCTAAAFLKEFVTCKHWVHLDIAGVMSNKDQVPYLNAGMSGRPTRTIIEFLHKLSQQKSVISINK